MNYSKFGENHLDRRQYFQNRKKLKFELIKVDRKQGFGDFMITWLIHSPKRFQLKPLLVHLQLFELDRRRVIIDNLSISIQVDQNQDSITWLYDIVYILQNSSLDQKLDQNWTALIMSFRLTFRHIRFRWSSTRGPRGPFVHSSSSYSSKSGKETPSYF